MKGFIHTHGPLLLTVRGVACFPNNIITGVSLVSRRSVNISVRNNWKMLYAVVGKVFRNLSFITLRIYCFVRALFLTYYYREIKFAVICRTCARSFDALPFFHRTHYLIVNRSGQAKRSLTTAFGQVTEREFQQSPHNDIIRNSRKRVSLIPDLGRPSKKPYTLSYRRVSPPDVIVDDNS